MTRFPLPASAPSSLPAGLLPLWGLLLLAVAPGFGVEVQERAVSVVADGRPVYRPDAFGNTVPDFSLAGYRHGGVALPVAPVLETLNPIAGPADDTARIQAANHGAFAAI